MINYMHKLPQDGDTEMQPLNDQSTIKKAEFTNLDPAKEYKVRVCTLINGRPIARKLHTIKPE